MKRIVLSIVGVMAPMVMAQERIPPRYNIESDIDRLPQKTPKETLRSVLAAIEAKRINYVLAHLAEPTFVDQRIKDTGGRFDVMVQETTRKLEADAESLRELRKFLTDGEWKDEETTASASCKDVRGKMVYFKKIGNRWFLENRTSPAKDAKDKGNDRPPQ